MRQAARWFVLHLEGPGALLPVCRLKRVDDARRWLGPAMDAGAEATGGKGWWWRDSEAAGRKLGTAPRVGRKGRNTIP